MGTNNQIHWKFGHLVDLVDQLILTDVSKFRETLLFGKIEAFSREWPIRARLPSNPQLPSGTGSIWK